MRDVRHAVPLGAGPLCVAAEPALRAGALRTQVPSARTRDNSSRHQAKRGPRSRTCWLRGSTTSSRTRRTGGSASSIPSPPSASIKPVRLLRSHERAADRPAILIETAEGSYIWDCAAFISPHLIAHMSELRTPLKAIAVSHPHVRFALAPVIHR